MEIKQLGPPEPESRTPDIIALDPVDDDSEEDGEFDYPIPEDGAEDGPSEDAS